MKKLIYTLLFVFAAIILSAQGKPSQWSNTTKNAVRTAIGIDTLPTTAEVTSIAESSLSVYYTAAQIDSILNLKNDRMLSSYKLLGSNVKSFPFNWYMPVTLTSHSIVDSRMILVMITITDTMTITGVGWSQYAQGDYLGDNYNGIALYSYSSGTATKVAETTNDSEMWKAAALSNNTKAFSAVYNASPGVYYIALLYNSSAQTSTPGLYCKDVLPRDHQLVGETNRFCAIINATTSMPSTFSNTDYTASTEAPSLWIY